MNYDWRNRRLLTYLAKARDLFIAERSRRPSARIARKDLHRVAAELLRLQERILYAARNRRVNADARAGGRVWQNGADSTRAAREESSAPCQASTLYAIVRLLFQPREFTVKAFSVRVLPPRRNRELL